jgi:predicted amidophosphoribosyltransferase
MKQTPIEEELQYREPMQVSEIVVFRFNPHDFSENAYPLCPRCGCPLEYDYQHFCEQCGQKLKWTYYYKAKVTYVKETCFQLGTLKRFNEI